MKLHSADGRVETKYFEIRSIIGSYRKERTSLVAIKEACTVENCLDQPSFCACRQRKSKMIQARFGGDAMVRTLQSTVYSSILYTLHISNAAPCLFVVDEIRLQCLGTVEHRKH